MKSRTWIAVIFAVAVISVSAFAQYTSPFKVYRPTPSSDAIIEFGDTHQYIRSVVHGGLRLGTYINDLKSSEDLVWLSQNGCVGIGMAGTSGPTDRLHVYGNAQTRITVQSNTAQSAVFRAMSSNSNFSLVADGGSNRFFIYDNGANAQRFTLTSTGNVGIGTTNPGVYKLAVEGKIGAREIIVTNSAWADHVFKPDYNLKPLRDVERFIRANNHLEGIPTAEEVKNHGVSLGDMQVKLLQKVEELTLYVIEQNKKIELLTRANEGLRNE